MVKEKKLKKETSRNIALPNEYQPGRELLHATLRGTNGGEQKWVERAEQMAEYVDTQAACHIREVQRMMGTGMLTEEEREQRLKNIKASRDFFLQPHEQWPQSPVIRLAQRFDTLKVGERNPNRLLVMQMIIERLFVQQYKDLITFAPHDATHALYVDELADQLFLEHPSILHNIQERYAISNGEARFASTLVNVLHDCGYPYIVNRNEMLSKSTHCVFGSDFMRQPKFQRAVSQLIATPNPYIPRLIEDMTEAVFAHSSDVGEEKYSVRIVTTAGIFLAHPQRLPEIYRVFQNPHNNPAKVARHIIRIEVLDDRVRHEVMDALNFLPDRRKTKMVQVVSRPNEYTGRRIDLTTPREALLGLELKSRSATSDPLRISLMIADNAHSGKTRRRAYETQPEFIRILHALGGATESATILRTLEKHASAIARKKVDLVSTKEIMKATAAKFMNISTESLNEFTAETILQRVTEHIVQTTVKNMGHLSPEEAAEWMRIGNQQISSNLAHVLGHLAIDRVHTQGYTQIVELNAYFDELKKSNLRRVVEFGYDESGGITPILIPIEEYVAWRIKEANEGTIITDPNTGEDRTLNVVMMKDGNIIPFSIEQVIYQPLE